jgi:hypothetical protein
MFTGLANTQHPHTPNCLAAVVILPSAHRYTPLQVAAGVGVASTILAGGVAAARDPDVADALAAPADRVWEQLESALPPLRSHPKLVLGAVGLAALGGAYMWRLVHCNCVVRVF